MEAIITAASFLSTQKAKKCTDGPVLAQNMFKLPPDTQGLVLPMLSSDSAISVISFPCWRISPTLLPANSYHGYGLGDHINVENSSITLGCWKDMPNTQQGSGLPSPQDITTVFTNTAEIWMRAITLADFSPSRLCCVFEVNNETFLHILPCILHIHVAYMGDWHDTHFLLSGSGNLLNIKSFDFYNHY